MSIGMTEIEMNRLAQLGWCQKRLDELEAERRSITQQMDAMRKEFRTQGHSMDCEAAEIMRMEREVKESPKRTTQLVR